MVKKVLLCALSLSLAYALTACGGGTTHEKIIKKPVNSEATQQTIDPFTGEKGEEKENNPEFDTTESSSSESAEMEAGNSEACEPTDHQGQIMVDGIWVDPGSYGSSADSTALQSDLESTETLADQSDTVTDPASLYAESISDENLLDLLDQVQGQLPANNGSWSVYVSDLTKGTEGAIDSHQMQAASLIKLYIMGAIYEDYDNIISRYGKENVDNYLYYMITVSDNDSANILTGYLGSDDPVAGMQAVNDYCQNHGFTDSHMGRLLLHSNEFDDNYTSVEDCGHFLRAVYENRSEEFPHAEDMLQLLSQQQRRHKIPSQIPSTVSVANKTGELNDVENDAAIIYNAANNLVIVFMTEQLTEVGNAQSSIGTIAHSIFDFYNN